MLIAKFVDYYYSTELPEPLILYDKHHEFVITLLIVLRMVEAD